MRSGCYGGPTLFVLAGHLVLSLPTTIYMLPFVLLLAVSIISQEGYEVAGFVLVAVLVIAVFFLVTFQIFGVPFFFVGATLWHPFVALSIGIGHGSGFRETYRITAYSSVLYILGPAWNARWTTILAPSSMRTFNQIGAGSWRPGLMPKSSIFGPGGSFVPFVGPLVALVAALYVSVHGVKGAHETTMVSGHHLRLGSVDDPYLLAPRGPHRGVFRLFAKLRHLRPPPPIFCRIGTIARYSLPRTG